jgi:hypothetical protein
MGSSLCAVMFDPFLHLNVLGRGISKSSILCLFIIAIIIIVSLSVDAVRANKVLETQHLGEVMRNQMDYKRQPESIERQKKK